MSETTQDPAEQDDEARAPRTRLNRVLAPLRALAGPRGHAAVQWSGQGFVYTLTAHRDGPSPVTMDFDPEARNGPALVELLRGALTP